MKTAMPSKLTPAAAPACFLVFSHVVGGLGMSEVATNTSTTTTTTTTTTTGTTTLTLNLPVGTCAFQGLPTGSPYNVSACPGTEPGKSCVVSCNAGFKAAQFVFECKEDGGFTGDVGQCEQAQCLGDGSPTGTGVNSSACVGILTDATCVSSCADGYQGKDTQVQCGLDGVLSGSAPTCAVGRCDITTGLLDSKVVNTCEVDGVKVAHQDSCLASCADGYEGLSTLLECDFPALKGTAPNCVAAACTRNVPFGSSLNNTACDGTTTGSSCSISCDEGFAPSAGSPSSPSATCFANGSFSEHGVTCEPKACGDLSTVITISFSDPSINTSSCNGVTSGETCSVVCAQGYMAESFIAQPLKCSAIGNPMTAGGYIDQNGAAPSAPLGCIAKECTSGIPSRLGVEHDCTGKKTAETCTASKGPGFTYATGSDETWTCGPDGVFTGTLPDVEPGVCADLTGLPAGVSTTCTGKVFGTSCWTYCQSDLNRSYAEYRCKMNGTSLELVLESSSATTCTSRRLLEAEFPAEPRKLAGACDGNLSSAGLTAPQVSSDCVGKAAGDTCVVECADGYTISGDPSAYKCETSGSLSGPGLPTCTPKTCTAGFPNGRGVEHNCTNATTGENCTAFCGTGYSGSSTELKCQSTGGITGTSPTCSPVACNPLILDQAFDTTACSGKTTGQDCVVYCNTGYTLSGNASLYACQPAGFSGARPTCNPNTCTQGMPKGSDLKIDASCSSLKTTQVCTVGCADGYQGTIENFTCGTTGSLTGTRPTCQRKTCPNTLPTTGGVSSGTCNNKKFGDKCTVGCAKGYKLASTSAPQDFTCAFNSGTGDVYLNGSAPVCDPIPCTYNVPLGATVSHNCTGVGTGGSCVVSCATGYVGTPQVYTCQDDATFLGAPPTCTPDVCPARPVAKVVDNCVATAVGKSCLASCAAGYTGTAKSWTCGVQSGSVLLNGPSPVCTGLPCTTNFPANATGTSHNCNGKVTGETCIVSCDAPLVGQQTWTCNASQAFEGMMPTCTEPSSGGGPDGSTSGGLPSIGTHDDDGLSTGWVVFLVILGILVLLGIIAAIFLRFQMMKSTTEEPYLAPKPEREVTV